VAASHPATPHDRKVDLFHPDSLPVPLAIPPDVVHRWLIFADIGASINGNDTGNKATGAAGVGPG